MSTIQICDVCSEPISPDAELPFKMVVPGWAWDYLGMPDIQTPIDLCGVNCLRTLADSIEEAEVNRDPGDGGPDDEDEDMNSAEDAPELPLIPQVSGGMPEGISLVTDYPTGVTMRS